MSNPWIKLFSDWAIDPHVQILAEKYQRRLIMLFLSDETFLDSERAFHWRISMEELAETKQVFLNAKFIDENWMLQNPIHISRVYERPLAHEWRIIRERIFRRDKYTCSYCGANGVRLECDHILPICKGGSSGDKNLTTACYRCNQSKKGKTLEEWTDKP